MPAVLNTPEVKTVLAVAVVMIAISLAWNYSPEFRKIFA